MCAPSDCARPRRRRHLHYLLLTSYYSLLTTYYPLLTAYYLLLATCFLLFISYFFLLLPYDQALAVWVTSISAEWMRLKHHNVQQAAAARQLLAAAPPVAATDGSHPPPTATGAGAPHAPPTEAQAHQLEGHLEAEDGLTSAWLKDRKSARRARHAEPPHGVPPGFT